MANKATELFETFSLGYPSTCWHLYASVAAAADKLKSWFAGCTAHLSLSAAMAA